MASQYFYQKQMGPRKTPPPKKTSLIEINGAVPDISMLSDCLGNAQVDTNGKNYSEYNHRLETRFEDTNTCAGQGHQQKQSSPGNILIDKGLFQSKEMFDDPTSCSVPSKYGDLNPPNGRTYDYFNTERRAEKQALPSSYGDSNSLCDRTYDYCNIEKRAERQVLQAQNDSDFDKECIDSYQSWRARNAALFATPENATRTVPEQIASHKMVDHHDAREDYTCLKLKDRVQSPEKSTADKYYEYFKKDKNPRSKPYDTGDLAKYSYSEKSIPRHSHHQIIRSREARFHYDPESPISDELDTYKHHKSKLSSHRNQYQSDDFIHEKVYAPREKIREPYVLCCDSPKCKQERFRIDEDYESRFVNENSLLRQRQLEDEEGAREFMCENRAIEEGINRTKKDGCSRNLGTRKLKKSSPEPKRRGRNRNCPCHECDDENIEERHCDLVKYKTSKSSSQRCRREVDESDSSLDCFPKRSCKNSRKRNALSFEDLCRFVKLQNEQILLIQKQVNQIGQKVDVIAQKVVKLELNNKSPVSAKSSDRRKSVENMEKRACNCEKEKNKAPSFKLSVVKENSQIECLQAVDNHNGVSIGVMTSCVEIMQKSQVEQKNVRQKKNECGENCDNHSDNDQQRSRSKKTIEKRKKKKKHCNEPMRSPSETRKPREISTVSDSFNLNEGELQVFREPTPSPEPSIHIDIEDFSSSSSASSGASSDDESEPNANCNSWDTNTDSDDVKMGWTLYNNIVGQVNNILQNPPPSSDNQKQMAVPSPEVVRKATLEQLRLLGVNLGDVDNTISKKVTFNQQLYPREDVQKEDDDPVMHLNALAKMYLQQEQFHQGTTRKELTDNIRNGNTNLSHATLCYLEKYKIKTGSANREKRFEAPDNGPIVTDIPRPQPRRIRHQNNDGHYNHHHNHPQHHQNHYPTSRILDITELKQQPKLL